MTWALDYAKGAGRPWPWGRLGVMVLVVVLWGVSMVSSVTYRIAVTGYGPVGDGSSRGYEVVQGVGRGQGAVIYQELRRQDRVGWVMEWRPVACRWWVFVREGPYWTVKTSGVPLVWVVAGVGLLLVPYGWGGRRR